MDLFDTNFASMSFTSFTWGLQKVVAIVVLSGAIALFDFCDNRAVHTNFRPKRGKSELFGLRTV